jgi:hypothetical protein
VTQQKPNSITTAGSTKKRVGNEICVLIISALKFHIAHFRIVVQIWDVEVVEQDHRENRAAAKAMAAAALVVAIE